MTMTKRQIGICLKKEYTNSGQTLREAIGKTDRNLESMLAGIIPTRPDGQYILLYQAFYFGRSFSFMKSDEIVAGFKCNRKIYLIGIFPFAFLNCYMICNDGTKIVKNESCPNFLLNKFTLF